MNCFRKWCLLVAKATYETTLSQDVVFNVLNCQAVNATIIQLQFICKEFLTMDSVK